MKSLPVVLHDGSRILLRKLDANYDPTDRDAASAAIQERLKKGEFLTGLVIRGYRMVRSSTMSMRHRLFRSIRYPMPACRRGRRLSRKFWPDIVRGAMFRPAMRIRLNQEST